MRALLTASLIATTTFAAPRDVALSLSILHDSVALPWTQRLDAPFHPGVRAGVEWTWLGSARHQLVQTAQLGFSSTLPVQRLLLLVTEAGYRFRFDVGVHLDALVALGYGHEFLGATAYRADSTFTATPQTGRPQALVGAVLGVGFDARQTLHWPVGVFIRYAPLFQAPYAPRVPVLPHVTLLAGARWFL